MKHTSGSYRRYCRYRVVSLIAVCRLSGSYAIGKKSAAIEKGRFGIYVDGKTG